MANSPHQKTTVRPSTDLRSNPRRPRRLPAARGLEGPRGVCSASARQGGQGQERLRERDDHLAVMGGGPIGDVAYQAAHLVDFDGLVRLARQHGDVEAPDLGRRRELERDLPGTAESLARRAGCR